MKTAHESNLTGEGDLLLDEEFNTTGDGDILLAAKNMEEKISKGNLQSIKNIKHLEKYN